MNFKTGTLILLGTLAFSTAVVGSEAIGFFSKGKLKDGESIMESGSRIHKLFLQRQKLFGTRNLNEVISDLADYMDQKYPDVEKTQLGDLSGEFGGVSPGHASHQNGLDVDIVYYTKNKKLQSQNAGYWEEDFVKKGVVTSNFDLERNFEAFKYLVHNHPVRRIFVDEAIKKLFCSHAKKNGLLKDAETVETLRRLRIQNLHSTHFHIRLTCPETDTACVEQAEVPVGSGC